MINKIKTSFIMIYNIQDKTKISKLYVNKYKEDFGEYGWNIYFNEAGTDYAYPLIEVTADALFEATVLNNEKYDEV